MHKILSSEVPPIERDDAVTAHQKSTSEQVFDVLHVVDRSIDASLDRIALALEKGVGAVWNALIYGEKDEKKKPKSTST